MGESNKKVFGLVAEFETGHDLVEASAKVRDAGYKDWDTHSPHPVHGIDEAMGIRRTILPAIVFVCGLAGATTGLAIQWYMNSADYPFMISGKPIWSLPAHIPIIFEITILFSAIGAVFGMLGLNGLPKLYHGLFNSRRFSERMTSDRFYISIEASDKNFDISKTRELLDSTGSSHVETVEEESSTDDIPQPILNWGKIAALIVVTLLFIPPLLIWKERSRSHNHTRIQLIWDMDQQPKFKSQSPNPIFADGRSMRAAVAGTVPRGEANTDDALNLGLQPDGQWVKEIPLSVNEKLLARGQNRFNIYCAQCHGLDGYGRGPVAVRAEKLQEGTWVAPALFHDEPYRNRENGDLFNTITNGIRTMPAYGDQITRDDRWAVVAYVRALMRSQRAKLDDVPMERRAELK